MDLLPQQHQIGSPQPTDGMSTPAPRAPDLERIRTARMKRQNQVKEWLQYDKKMSRIEDGQRKSGTGGSRATPSSTLDRRSSRSRQQQGGESRSVQFPQSILLLEAAARGDVDEVRALLRSGMCPDVASEDGLTALHQCCIDNNPTMCRVLLSSGANPNARDLEQWTPLHAAATCQNYELSELLIKYNADLLAMNVDGNMPYECCGTGPTLTVIEEAMEKQGITQEQLDDLHRIPECRMLEDLENLHKAGADFNKLDHQGAAPIEIIELLANFNADLMAETPSGETIFDVCDDPTLHVQFARLCEELEKRRAEQQEREQRQRATAAEDHLDSNSQLSPTNSDKPRGSTLVRRRSSTNPRSSSIRRRSMREKKQMSQKEAKQEAELLGGAPLITSGIVEERNDDHHGGTWPNGGPLVRSPSPQPHPRLKAPSGDTLTRRSPGSKRLEESPTSPSGNKPAPDPSRPDLETPRKSKQSPAKRSSNDSSLPRRLERPPPSSTNNHHHTNKPSSNGSRSDQLRSPTASRRSKQPPPDLSARNAYNCEHPSSTMSPSTERRRREPPPNRNSQSLPKRPNSLSCQQPQQTASKRTLKLEDNSPVTPDQQPSSSKCCSIL